MRRALKRLFRYAVWLYISLIYLWARLFYKKEYLTGSNFNRWHLSPGWTWVKRFWFVQKLLGYNRHVPWPVPPWTHVANPDNILFDNDDMGFFHSAGNYFQGIGATVTIGKGTKIAPGVGLITANHDEHDLSVSAPGKPIEIGPNCWIGMNAVLLPGVCLGERTIVGAGSVVTKSFPEGRCVIAGNPARLLRVLDDEGKGERI